MGSDRSSELTWPKLGLGLGLRTTHYSFVLEHLPPVDWFETVSENFMGHNYQIGGKPLATLEKIREHYPIVLHGVSLSLGSVDPLNQNYLNCLKKLVERIEPSLVSDHLCWTGVNGENVHDLLPLPYTGEALDHLVDRIRRVQDFLGRRILVENVSSYLTYRHSEMPEWEFLAEVAKRSDCGLLLDINNIYVSSVNHGFDPEAYLAAIPADRIGQFHLAGYTDNGNHLVDTHDQPVSEAVWALYERALRRYGIKNTLLERDDNIPEFAELQRELARAATIQEELFGKSQPRRNAKVDAVDHLRF